jgi:hypothetical protein
VRGLLGPPWISIEYPANPYDRSARGAYLLVHAFHHGTPMGLPVSGSAEGMVRGERRTVRLDFAATARPGVYALRKQWSDEGTWTLVVRVGRGADDAATALVELAPGGEVARVQVPTRREREGRLPARRHRRRGRRRAPCSGAAGEHALSRATGERVGAHGYISPHAHPARRLSRRGRAPARRRLRAAAGDLGRGAGAPRLRHGRAGPRARRGRRAGVVPRRGDAGLCAA